MAALPSIASLDGDIQRVRDEVKRLAARKSALQTAILSDRDTTDRLEERADSHQKGQLRRLVDRQASLNARNAYRVCAGVTLFDPSIEGPPIKPARGAAGVVGPLLGVRFERYDRNKRVFLEPAYVFLESQDIKVSDDLEDEASDLEPSISDLARRPLRVVHHTLPAHIPVTTLERQLLFLGEGSKSDAPDESRLLHFARECQNLLSADLRRHQILIELSNSEDKEADTDDSRSAHIKTATALTPDAREIQIEWQSGLVGRLVVDATGKIFDALVHDSNGRRDEVAERQILRVEFVSKLGDASL